MHLAKPIRLLLRGTVTGIAFVISCGDNLHLSADATDAPQITDASQGTDAALTCDCPAAEPPLAGRFVVVSQIQVVPPNNNSYQGAVCPEGSMAISGGCTTDVVNPIRNVALEQSGLIFVPPSSWHCMFRNREATPTTIRVSVICLKPAP